MDMKKILQAFDGASTKPVEGANDMTKFLSIIDKNDVSIIKEEINNNTVLNEGSNPHKVTLPVQMAMQHYQEPVIKQPRAIKEVKKTAMSSLLYQYYTEAETEVEGNEVSKKEIISEQARQIASRILAKENRLDELSKETLSSYKEKAEAQVKELEPHAKDGEYKDLAKNAIERRKKGIEKADKKIAAKESQDPAEYDEEGRSVKNSLSTAQRAVEGLSHMLGDNDNLPEWCQEKISIAEDYLVTVWDYLQSEEGMQESYYRRPDAYERDYQSSISGMGGHRREIDDEANLMYIYKDGRLKQRMVSNHEEWNAKKEGFRDSQKAALAVAGIHRSKYDPNKFIQKVGTQWVQVYPFGKPEEN